MPPTLAAALACLLAACTPGAGPPAPATDAKPAAAAKVHRTPPRIPPAFVGEWNALPADCGTSRNDSRLRIAPDRITYWESSGPVTAVRITAPGAIEVRLQLSGEGETWTRIERLELQGDVLTAIDEAGGRLQRQRCPPPARP